MKKQTIIGFLKSRMEKIAEMQSEGYYLQTIFEEIKKDYPEEISFKTFKDYIYRIRNKKISDKFHLNKIVVNNQVDKNQDSKTDEQAAKSFKWNPQDKSNIDF